MNVIVQTVYTASTKEEKEAIRDQIWTAIEESKKDAKKTPVSGGEKQAPGRGDTIAASPNKLDRLGKHVFEGLNGGVQGELPI